MSKAFSYCTACGENTTTCICQTPGEVALNLYRRLHNIHKHLPKEQELTKQLGVVCDELLELAAVIAGDGERKK